MPDAGPLYMASRIWYAFRMHNHRKLQVWNRSVQLTSDVYRHTASFPRDEQFGLIAQMRRAAVSIVSNIAEGSSRRSSKEFRRFIEIALGSAAELDAQLVVSNTLGLAEGDATSPLLDEVDGVRAMLVSLSRAIEDQ
jgi:four helix bundle protein